MYRLFCEICNYKKITDGVDVGLQEVAARQIPGGSPKLDPETQKIIVPQGVKLKKKFKCPQCGRWITPVKIEDVHEKTELQKDMKKRVENNNEQDWAIGRKESVERFSI